MQRFTAIIFIATLALGASATLPACADSPFGLGVGPSIMFQSAARQVGGTDQLNINATLDLGGSKHFPLRNSLMFDYAGGSANGGSLNDYGLGFGTRLTTPVYIGAGAFLYSVNANQGPVVGTHTATGFGSNIFVGEKILDVPGGAAFAAQLTYRQIPIVNGINPGGLAATLRVSL